MARAKDDRRTVEVGFEQGVFRPLEPVAGVAEHERATVVLGAAIAGRLADVDWTLSPEEALELTRTLDAEFERIEGDW